MTAKYTIPYYTGLFIPVEKQSLFLVAFEDMLISAYNLVPLFGPATRSNFCEVKFNYLGNKSYKPGSVVSDLEKALEFLRSNMSILGPRKTRKGRKAYRFDRLKASPQVINLEDESDVGSVSLIHVDEGDPEVIVLEDSFSFSGRGSQQIGSSVVDLTSISEFSETPRKRKVSENEIQILSVKKPKSQTLSLKSTPNSEIKILENVSRGISCGRNKKTKKKKKKKGMSITRTISNFSMKSGSFVSLSSTDSVPHKKRKLQDISNLHSVDSCSSSSSAVQPSQLSENTLKYYENISVVVGKAEEGKQGNSTRNCFSVRTTLGSNAKRKYENPSRKISPHRICVGGQSAFKKRKMFSPKNSLRRNDRWSHQRKLFQISPTGQKFSRRIQSPQEKTRKRILRQQLTNSVRKIEETNIFNPNPCEVDLEGLRPIVIDGCNVAIGHGKGEFSPNGLKICVDYFAGRGHTKIKVFLPQFRQEEFSQELLKELKTKCDVLFTPSQCINGKRRTSYDDRFIIQYATEFGGVIVSTDNYRDLLRENPRWQDTIEKRLLMFTWVDDFLMFPVDPLGRTGPTLEEFLRF